MALTRRHPSLGNVGQVAGSRDVTRPVGGSWADENGPGRCRRCKRWLEHNDVCEWGVRLRPADTWHDVFRLCGDCSRAVLNVWGVRASKWLFPE